VTTPERLQRRGRPIVCEFPSDEPLYRAIEPESVAPAGVSPISIRFPAWSVNRGGRIPEEDGPFSEPGDVLLPENRRAWAVARFRVRDVPGRTITFGVEHDPLDDNYAHSELRAYVDGEFHENARVSTGVKKAFRARLAPKLEIIIPPGERR